MARKVKHIQDKFYTKLEVVSELLKTIDLEHFDYVIEPSAGDGSFYNLINHKNKIGLDIEPESSNIIKQDWFDFKINTNYEKVLVVGNPPFGNQGSLAMKFIKKCDELKVNTIAFILQKSFKKDSTKRRVPLNYHLKLEVDLDDNSYTLLGNDYSVPTVWQVWERNDVRRILEPVKTESEHLKFVKKSDNPFYTMRRVGFYAGKIYDDVEKSEQSHYFIDSNDNIKQFLSSLIWEHNNTTGPKSIGKSEIVKVVDNYMNNLF
jgi:hypothetical protein